MRDPENPQEYLPAVAKSQNLPTRAKFQNTYQPALAKNQTPYRSMTEPKTQIGSRQLMDRDDVFLWYLRNSTQILLKYGIAKSEGKYKVVDMALLERRCEREIGLRELLRRLWENR